MLAVTYFNFIFILIFQNLSKSTMVDDINGKSMQALEVFSLSIEYFKNHLLETIRTRAESVDLGYIHFVITVPTIWNDSAKQFMREAAVLVSMLKL